MRLRFRGVRLTDARTESNSRFGMLVNLTFILKCFVNTSDDDLFGTIDFHCYIKYGYTVKLGIANA